MPQSTATRPTNPTAPTASASAVLTPLDLADVRISGGFWLQRQEANRTTSIPDGLRRLHEAGNLANFTGAAKGAADPVGPIFADSDVYKWLEAAAWEYGRDADEQLLADQLEVTAIVAGAQDADGYLNTVVPARRGARYTDPSHDHELYCAGHLFQAAVAQSRATGHRELLEVAVRFADHLVTMFGPGTDDYVEGHPVVEMGLVELYRETGTDAYLELARRFIDTRGHGELPVADSHFDSTYFSDRVPVRETTSPEGHAVRAVYLAAGAADVAAEDGDGALLTALRRQYDGMTEAKQYVTGGLGSRWEGEAFGDPFELPSDRAYAETCAGIGALQWAWRLLLATGDPIYGDQIERLLYNAILPGVSLAGAEYFYVNTLHVRSDAHADDERSPANGRRGWFDVACCPPNIMRTLASLGGYLATTTDRGLQLHQYATGAVHVERLSIEVATDYPFDGAIRITVTEAAEGDSTLSLRIPAWADGATIDGAPAAAGTYADVTRSFAAGDVVELVLPMAVRIVRPDDRVDAVRGAVAFERGPLVYAVEQVDQAPDVVLDDLRLADAPAVVVAAGPGLLDHDVALRLPATQVGRGGRPDRDVTVTAVPYLAWANREVGPMRIWLHRA